MSTIAERRHPALTRAPSLRLEWHWLVSFFVVVVLAIPIRRYTTPFGGPIQLEPYRVLLILLVLAWLLDMLVNPRSSVSRTILDRHIAAFLGAIAISVLLNPARVSALSGSVAKNIGIFVGFIALYYFVASVLRDERAIDAVIWTLVIGGCVLSILGLVEAKTGRTPFDDLSRYLPFLTLMKDFSYQQRGGELRAMASAEHPIAFGVLLSLILPLGLYLIAKYRHPVIWALCLVIALGAFASVSRTVVVMLGIGTIVYLFLKPAQTIRFWPLVFPLIVGVHFAVPGTLGTLKAAFFGDQLSNAGRTQDYGPAWQSVLDHPLAGQGFGTRIVTGLDANAAILDNQWLGLLLETGLIGVIAMLWLLLTFVVRLGRAGSRSDTPESWLAVGLSAAVAAWIGGMLLFDAFSFIQEGIVLFILLALGSSLLSLPTAAHGPRPLAHERAVP